MENQQLNAPAVMLLCFSLMTLVLSLRTLRSALQKCAPGSRTMAPGKVWLISIPVFGLVWQFIVVLNIAKSIGKEFARLGISSSDATPGRTVGLACCVCNCGVFFALCGGFVTLTGFLFLAGLVLWIVYWIRIANCSRLLQAAQCMTPASTIA